MNFKRLGKKAYNKMHHAHTVSGLMISFALFVIFYAGALSLFRGEIQQWENSLHRAEEPIEVDYDRAVQGLIESYEVTGLAPIFLYPAHEGHPEAEISSSIPVGENGTYEYVTEHIDEHEYQFNKSEESSEYHTVLSQTIYELHYFRQIPYIGMYLAGFTGLFFLLATITGVLIHWRNITNKFYAFFVGKRWKQIWTDAHTLIGVISLPFQIMYAITGALFGLTLLLLVPSVMVMFGGDQTPVYSAVQPHRGIETVESAPSASMMSINTLEESVKSEYPDHEITRITINNYGTEAAIVTFEINDHIGLFSYGILSYDLEEGSLINEFTRIPYQRTYSEAVLDVMTKLHFGSYGGYVLRFIYFFLSILTCFMIISGVLIWQTARDKKKYSPKRRKFQHRITKLNLVLSLSLFPAFAIIFIANKAVPVDYAGHGELVKLIFFVFWVILAAIGWKWNHYKKLTNNYFLVGGILSFLVPVSNGIVTGDWFWSSFSTMPVIASIDLFWIGTGCSAILAAYLNRENTGENESLTAATA